MQTPLQSGAFGNILPAKPWQIAIEMLRPCNVSKDQGDMLKVRTLHRVRTRYYRY